MLTLVALAVAVAFGLRVCGRAETSFRGVQVLRKTRMQGEIRQSPIPIPFAFPAVSEDPRTLSGELSGWVVDAESETAVVGATVTFGMVGTAHATMTDVDGSFRFRPSAAGEYRLMGIVAPEFETAAWDWERSQLHVLLVPGRRLSGIKLFLRRRRETQCVGEVMLENGDAATGARVHSIRTSGAALSAESPWATTDVNGSFTTSCSPDDILHAELGGLSGRAYPSLNGRSRITLAPTPSVAITGSVVDSLGGPVADVVLDADSVDMQPKTHATSVTDSNGEFTFVVSSPGTYDITSWSEASFVAARARVEAPTRNVALKMTPLKTLKLRCLMAGGGSLPAMYEVTASRASEGVRTTRVEGRVQLIASSSGELVLAGMPPGTYRIRVAAAGVITAEVDLTIPVDEARVEDVFLQRREQIRAVVKDSETKRPIAGANVIVHDWSTAFRENSASQSTLTGEDGRIELLPTAAMKLVVHAPGYRDWNLTIGEFTPSDLDVELERERLNGGEGLTGPAQFGGVGLVLSDTFHVLELLSSSPAELSGVVVGDQLRSVDGLVPTSVFEARTRIQGAPGSSVRLGFLRTDGGTLDVTLVRQRLSSK